MEKVKTPKNGEVRVAVYIRFGSDAEESLVCSKDYIQRLFEQAKQNPEFKLKTIFRDIACSGLNTENRTEFKRMIDKCLNGEFDYIVTKSISRFSRNIHDVFEYTQILKNHNVGIIFETENIDTLKFSPIFEIYKSFYEIESKIQ